MKRVTKNRKLSFEKLDLDKLYSLDEASELVRDITTTKFDANDKGSQCNEFGFCSKFDRFKFNYTGAK